MKTISFGAKICITAGQMGENALLAAIRLLGSLWWYLLPPASELSISSGEQSEPRDSLLLSRAAHA